jgi:hypothetical protein
VMPVGCGVCQPEHLSVSLDAHRHAAVGIDA